jgi:hypothetical protein
MWHGFLTKVVGRVEGSVRTNLEFLGVVLEGKNSVDGRGRAPHENGALEPFAIPKTGSEHCRKRRKTDQVGSYWLAPVFSATSSETAERRYEALCERRFNLTL